MRKVKKPFETFVDDGIYSRSDLRRKVADMPADLKTHPQVHGLWGFIDDHDPRNFALVIENGNVSHVLDKDDYKLVRPVAESMFEQAFANAKAAKEAKAEQFAIPKVEDAEVVPGPELTGLAKYHAEQRAKKAAERAARDLTGAGA